MAPVYISIRDLYMRLGLLSVMEPETEEVMRTRARRDHFSDEHDSPHERPWYQSFHVSQFPGDQADACARRLVYRMMNVPAEDPVDPWVTSTGVVGKAIELDIVDAWFKDGRSLAVPEDSARPGTHQLGFEDGEHWLTGSTDLPLLPRGWRRPHIVEIKAKSDDVLVEMIQGRQVMRDGQALVEPRGPDAAHVAQLKATIGLAHEYEWGSVDLCPSCWRIIYADIFWLLTGGRLNPAISLEVAAEDNLRHCPWCAAEVVEFATFDLEPPSSGELYYASRSWPRGHPRSGRRTKTFYYEHDPDFMSSGRSVLAAARSDFIDGSLPRRPSHMQWGSGPCRFCSYKKACRLDEGLEPGKRRATSEPVLELAESNGIVQARSVRPHYDYQSVRSAVLERWLCERSVTGP